MDVTDPVPADKKPTAFEGDLFNRRQTSKVLTSYIDKLKYGSVIGITSDWGTGKTWFGRNWCAQLGIDHKVAFIDAFENDFVDDPFMLIVAEISKILEDSNDAKVVKKRAIKVMRAIIPVGFKTAVRLAGKAVGVENINEDFADAVEEITTEVADKSEKWLEKKLDELAQQQERLQQFKETLKSAVAKSERPVIVFIDELDRCSPYFAVTLIERLKHLFDVPNLVFILLLNRHQLERSVEGFYGVGTDGHGYLSKFVNIWFDLPKVNMRSEVPDRRIDLFFENVLARYEIGNSKLQAASDFVADSSEWVKLWNLSLRDIERMCTLFILAEARNSRLLNYLIALKVRDANLFSRLRTMYPTAHKEAAALLSSSIGGYDKDSRYPLRYFATMLEMHRVFAGELDSAHAVMFNQYGELMSRGYSSPERAFVMNASYIDLPVLSE